MMRLSSLCLSTLLAGATVTLSRSGGAAAGAGGGSGGRGFYVAAFAASSSSLSRESSSSSAASAAPAHARAFVVHDRIRAGGGLSPLPSSSSSSSLLRKASTQESVDVTSSSENADADAEEEEHDDSENAELRSQILSAARRSADICGPSTTSSTFGNLPYVDTTLLDASSPKQHRVLFVLGGPGAGKGTQSDRIVESYKCVHLSVGELLRAERERGDKSPHAELIEDALVNGKIVPVEISLELLRNAMDESAKSAAADGNKYGSRIFLVDGFPRNFDNLDGWTSNMPESASTLGVLCYDCPQDVLEARILKRAETSGRSDDNLESARKRFRTFREQTMPVVNALEEVERTQREEGGESKEDGDAVPRMHVKRIVADGSVEQVWNLTREAMDSFVKDDVLSACARLMKAVDEGDAEAYGKACDPALLVNDEDEKDEAAEGDDRITKIFHEYESATVQASPDGPTDAIRTPTVTQKNVISNAEVDVQDGTHAVVSYDRTMTLTIDGQEYECEPNRETRVWRHGEDGWACVHFYRKPL